MKAGSKKFRKFLAKRRLIDSRSEVRRSERDRTVDELVKAKLDAQGCPLLDTGIWIDNVYYSSLDRAPKVSDKSHRRTASG